MMLLIIISVTVTPVFERNDLKTDAVSAETDCSYVFTLLLLVAWMKLMF